VEELLLTFSVESSLQFLISFSNPAAPCDCTVHCRRHFKHYLKWCCQHKK